MGFENQDKHETLECWVILHIFCHLIFFQKKFFHEHHQSVKQLDPDQARHVVGPGLGPNC